MNDFVAEWYRDIPFLVPAIAVIAALTVLLAVASAVTICLGIRRARGADRRVTGYYEAAFLSGGPARVADTALAELHADGVIDVVVPGIGVRRGGDAAEPVARTVIELIEETERVPLPALRAGTARSRAVQAIGDSLAERGLLARPSTVRRVVHRWARLQNTGILLCLPVCFVLTFVIGFGLESAGPPFIFMMVPVLGPAAVVAHLCAVVTRGGITPAGLRALGRYRRSYGKGSTARVALQGPRHAAYGRSRDLLVDAATVSVTVAAVDLGVLGGGGTDEVNWCGGTGGSGCGGGSCGGGGGSACGGGGGGSSCGGSGGGSSCGSGGGSSCGGGGGGSACASASV
ncbi:TIGR04222 domain-containing membrane protein [Streptomyces sp. NPDC006798]|uniref:TIGR04222 domain-containing membrane protein n=1 Tax=Streptomyces sp. NPDC006798 TaxID=3155462 RepID=UPI0033D17A74